MWDLMTFDLLLLSLVAGYNFTVQISQPHIIFILADDMGWNDVSFHGSDQIPTPNIDALGYHGVILNRHYVQPVCTPSRASLLTGKYPFHTGLHDPLASNQRTGLNLSEKILPEYLKDIGYKTHMIGKWHLGFYEKSFTPLQRGFCSHFGYWSGIISYYDHICQDTNPVRPYNSSFSGHDLRRDYKSAWNVVGEYATDLFTREAVRIIKNHPHDKPMFLYLSHLAVHAGNDGKLLEAPQEVINRFGYITDPNRRTYAAMVSKLDESVGIVIEALNKNRMLENSIVVFLADNGAPIVGLYSNWGSNYPFRGQKDTLWEGAVRTPAVVWSPLIKDPSKVSYNLMHITDWFPTLLVAAGSSVRPKAQGPQRIRMPSHTQTQAGRSRLPAGYNPNNLSIDGFNQWQAISKGVASPRNHVVVEIDSENNRSALVVNSFKYIKGPLRSRAHPIFSSFLNFHSIVSSGGPKYNIEELISSPTWQALQQYSPDPNLKYKVRKLRQDSKVMCDHNFAQVPNCTADSPCLFNILDDPCEQDNIANFYPKFVYFIEKLIESYERTGVPDTPLISDPASNPEFFNNTWSIWVS